MRVAEEGGVEWSGEVVVVVVAWMYLRGDKSTSPLAMVDQGGCA